MLVGVRAVTLKKSKIWKEGRLLSVDVFVIKLSNTNIDIMTRIHNVIANLSLRLCTIDYRSNVCIILLILSNFCVSITSEMTETFFLYFNVKESTTA